MFQLVKIIDSSAPHQGDIRCFKKNGGEAVMLYSLLFTTHMLYVSYIFVMSENV